MRKFATSTGYARDLRMRRNAAGLCGRCGKPLDDGKTTCSNCRLRKNMQVKQNQERKRIENKMSKDKRSSQEIDRINAMAKEKGLSYGIFVALQGNI